MEEPDQGLRETFSWPDWYEPESVLARPDDSVSYSRALWRPVIPFELLRLVTAGAKPLIDRLFWRSCC